MSSGKENEERKGGEAALRAADEGDGHSDVAWQVAWSPSGELLVSAGGDCSLQVWGVSGSPPTLKLRQKVKGFTHRTVRSVAFGPAATRMLATAGFDGAVFVWGYDTSATTDPGRTVRPVARLTGNKHEAKSIAWSDDGRLLACCGRDGKLRVWRVPASVREACEAYMRGDASGGFRLLCTSVAHKSDAKSLRFLPRSHNIISTGYDHSWRLWSASGNDATDAKKGAAAGVQDSTEGAAGGGQDTKKGAVAGDQDSTEGAAGDQDSKEGAGGESTDQAVGKRGEGSKKAWKCIGGGMHGDTVWETASVPCGAGEGFVSCAGDASLAQWSAMSVAGAVKPVAVIGTPHTRAIYSLDSRARGTGALLASAGGDNGIAVYTCDASRGVKLATWLPDAHPVDVNCVRWRPPSAGSGTEDAVLASCGDDGTVRLWTLTL